MRTRNRWMRRAESDPVATLVGVVIAVVLMLIIGPCKAKCESDTYNRLTGSHTSWWDALWVELRVMDAPQR